MPWVDIIGYVGAVFVLVAYTMKTMIPLRMMAIGSNVAAIIYGVLAGLKPILFLHLTLLPLNAYRTYEMVRLLRRVEQASRGDLNIDWLKPYMKSVSYRAGDILFEKGAHAERLFYIVAGEIRLEEIGKRIGPGHLLGEIGFFTPDQNARRPPNVRRGSSFSGSISRNSPSSATRIRVLLFTCCG